MAAHIAHLFETTWLAQYPRLQFIIHDNGTEFIGILFQRMLQIHGIHIKRISVYTPTANAHIKRTHQSLGNILRIRLYLRPPSSKEQIDGFVREVCSAAMYDSQLSAHRSLMSNTASILTFQRPTLTDVPMIEDWVSIASHRQHLIDKAIAIQNKHHCDFDYQPGDQVLVYKEGILQKTATRFDGPFTIVRVHTNGMVTIQSSEFVSERISIWRLKPYQTEPSVEESDAPKLTQ
jgi:hypothetical protein